MSAQTSQKEVSQTPQGNDRARVFLSYSRQDVQFADQLVVALGACNFDPIIDREGIAGGEDWKRRLGNLIQQADTVVFVVSPASTASELCQWEVEEAARLGKRIIPVVCAPIVGTNLTARLQELNYIYFYGDPKHPGSGFGSGLAGLIGALNSDLDWLREHTRLFQRATEWKAGGQLPNRLLFASDIADARAWLSRRPKGAAEPTGLHLEFIRASEEAEQERAGAEQRRLEEMTSAQVERARALSERETALRQRSKLRSAAIFALAAGLTLAGWQWWRAEVGKTQAIEATEKANLAKDKAERALFAARNQLEGLDARSKSLLEAEQYIAQRRRVLADEEKQGEDLATTRRKVRELSDELLRQRVEIEREQIKTRQVAQSLVEANARSQALTDQMKELRKTFEEREQSLEARIKDLTMRLNLALAQRVEDLKRCGKS